MAKTKRLLAVALLVGALGATGACGEAEEPVDNDDEQNQQVNNDDNNQDQNDNDETGLEYATLWGEMEDGYGCSGDYCHGGGAAPEVSTREVVVDVESECDDTILVVPGEPEESLLWQKVAPEVDGSDVCGDKMPPTSDAGIHQELADDVYDWIEAGAGE